VDGRQEFPQDPATFHEILCRRSFANRPVFGVAKGCKAQRALLHGGTLENRKLAVEVHWSHGVLLRELIAQVRFEHKDVVTCYGGFAEKAPVVKKSDVNMHTHMRQIPGTDYVLEGEPFSNCFPVKQGAMFDLGYSVPLRPQCADPRWAKVIASSGLGYMANTVTRCPLILRTRTNVTVCDAVLGRSIPGVPYDSVVYLKASAGGINPGEPIISPYEPWKLKEKFKFKCNDSAHYEASGRVQSSEDESEDSM
jgi:hypothetical protein